MKTYDKPLKTLPGTIVLGKGDVAVGNVLTAGLLKKDEFSLISSHITWKEFDEYKQMVEDGNAINYIGHPSTASLLGMEANRVTLQASAGSTLVVAQYDGPRLDEGATDLPQGATLLPTKWEVMRIPKWIKTLIRLWNKYME